jgi:hypothetical protein
MMDEEENGLSKGYTAAGLQLKRRESFLLRIVLNVQECDATDDEKEHRSW